MLFTEAVEEAYNYALCVDFYTCTISDSDGNEWYWNREGGGIQNFIDLMKEVVEFLENKEC